MIEKDMIQTEVTHRLTHLQVTSSINLEDSGYVRDQDDDQYPLLYATHNNIVDQMYGDLIERLQLLSHEILSIDHGQAVEVNDSLSEIISSMECLYLKFGEDKEVF